MAITIPSAARPTFEKVLGAMGGEDYSYYLFDVKEVAEDPGKKVQIALKVFVPDSERQTAPLNVQSSLDGDDVISIIGGPKSDRLDVSINEKQIIRLEFKPANRKGSGGGAAATKIQEAAQQAMREA